MNKTALKLALQKLVYLVQEIEQTYPPEDDTYFCSPSYKQAVNLLKQCKPNSYWKGKEFILCTCTENCSGSCKGGCGCKACGEAYSDFLDEDYE